MRTPHCFLTIALACAASLALIFSAERANADASIRFIDARALPSASREKPLSPEAAAPSEATKPCSRPKTPKVERLEALGPLTAVIEPDILALFQSRIRRMKADGTYDRRFREAKERIRRELQNPSPVSFLRASEALRVRAFTPSIPEALPERLLREARNTELPKLSRALLFIDARDEESLKAARVLLKTLPQTRVVLTAGSLALASEALDRRMFFDQGGSLSRLFGLQSVPALIFNGDEGVTVAEFPASAPEGLLPYLRS